MKKSRKYSSQFGAATFREVGRWGITVGVIFVLLILSAFPFPYFAEIKPAFLLVAVYYWAIFRPQMLSPVGAFASGLALDLVSGWYLGLSALTLVIVQWVVLSQRRFLLAQSFAVIWCSFALVALLAGVLQWAVYALFELRFISIRGVLTGVLMTSLSYPLIALPLFRINKLLQRRSSSFG